MLYLPPCVGQSKISKTYQGASFFRTTLANTHINKPRKALKTGRVMNSPSVFLKYSISSENRQGVASSAQMSKKTKNPQTRTGVPMSAPFSGIQVI